jgi:TonB family protein
VAIRLAERLSLVTNTEWKPVAAALLLRAATRLHEQLNASDSCGTVRSAVDTLLQRSVSAIKLSGTWSTNGASFSCDSVDLSQPAVKSRITGAVLGVTSETADLLLEYVVEPKPGSSAADSAEIRNLVAGLVFSSSKSKRGEPQRKNQSVAPASGKVPAAEPSDNSEEALRFRGQASIRDSIEKHIPNLRQLYKKILKTNASLAGNVLVTIRVDAAGGVIGIKIKSSEIDNRMFLESFASYIRTIRFAPIPEKVGTMSFDFPFEFNPEM